MSAPRVATPAKHIPTIVRWSFLAFIFTLPFDAGDLSFFSRLLSLTKLFGLVFFGFYFFYYGPLAGKRSFPRPPQALWWSSGYILIYTLNGFFMEQLSFQFYQRLATLIQLLAFFWLASSLLKDERLAKDAVLAYLIGATLVALSIIAGGSALSPETQDGRMTSMGEDPNTQSVIMGLAALMLLGLLLNKNVRFFGGKILLPVLGLPLLVAIVHSGSRTGMGAFIIGISPYLLLWSRRVKMGAVALAIVAMLGVGYLIATNPVALERWRLVFEEGSLARREMIIPIAIDMISERPLFGWQPVLFWDELGRRTKGLWEITDAHNLFLHLFLEVGAVGAFPFLVGLWLCGRAAWRARRGNLGYLPLALLLTILSANMSITWLARKSMWFVLALAVAAEPRRSPKSKAASYASGLNTRFIKGDN